MRDKFLGKEEKANTLLSLFSDFLEKQNKLVGIDITQSTFNKYSFTYRRLQEFLIETMNRKDIPIRNVNHDFVYQFRIYLKADKKLSINSSEKLMRIFKRITTFAFKTELILCNPFAFYTKRTGGLPKKSSLSFTASKHRITGCNAYGISSYSLAKADREQQIGQCFKTLSYLLMGLIPLLWSFEVANNPQHSIRSVQL